MHPIITTQVILTISRVDLNAAIIHSYKCMQLQYTANPIINTFYVIGVNRLLYLQEGNKSFLYILELSQKLIMNLTTKNVNFLNGLVSFLWVTYSDCKSIIFEINDRLNRNSDNLKIYFYKYYVGSVRK